MVVDPIGTRLRVVNSVKTVVIADDHPLFRTALREALKPVVPGARVIEADSFPIAFGNFSFVGKVRSERGFKAVYREVIEGRGRYICPLFSSADGTLRALSAA